MIVYHVKNYLGGGITDQTEANEDVSLGRATMAVGELPGHELGLCMVHAVFPV